MAIDASVQPPQQGQIAARTVKGWVRSTLIHMALIPAAAIFLLPFLWMLSTSLKSDTQLFAYPPIWIPNPLQWLNYPRAVTYVPFFTYLRNTLIIAIGSMIGATFSSSLVAYSLARIRWPGRHILLLLTIATLMLPYQVTIIPVFLVFKHLGWVGDFRPLILPQFFCVAYYIFLLRQFFTSIPQELSEAARIDGANELRIYWSIVMPLAKPALAVVAIFQFIRSWTDYLGPLIYLNDQNLYTLQLGLYQYSGEHGREWGLLMAAAVLITLPPIVIFFLTQRTFVQGVTLTGIKG
jgi:multiple sugar transport system permease protein